MNRVAFLVDGFNVYHSLREAEPIVGRPLKWLDLNGLCASYARRGFFDRQSVLRSVTYFSAYATFRSQTDPSAVTHHRTYVRALDATGVETVMGRFKARSRRCPACGTVYRAHEEKETDVAIALRILEVAHLSDCDSIVIVTGDTDILPAIRAARLVAPDKPLVIGFPYRRFNHELRAAAGRHFKIRPQAYARHQLPNPVTGPDGAAILKPPQW